MSSTTGKGKTPPPHVSSRAQRRIEEEKRAKQRRYLMIGVPVLVVLIAAVVVAGMALGGGNEATPTPNPALPAVVAAQPMDASIPRDGRVLGDANAPATLTVWADYQCPFCGNFSKTIIPQIVNDFVKTGKLKIEYKDMPFLDGVTGYGESDMAADAAACAGDQGKFWEMHDTIYANQNGENQGSYSKARLKEMAALVPGLDTEKFNTCFDERTHKDEIAAMQAEGQKAGVTSTPTLFLNGQRLTYTGQYEDLKTALQAVTG